MKADIQPLFAPRSTALQGLASVPHPARKEARTSRTCRSITSSPSGVVIEQHTSGAAYRSQVSSLLSHHQPHLSVSCRPAPRQRVRAPRDRGRCAQPVLRHALARGRAVELHSRQTAVTSSPAAAPACASRRRRRGSNLVAGDDASMHCGFFVAEIY
eukprot:7237388-Prymnesium_polylepis.1